jgi:Domain of unknown function (DUF4178)
MQAYRCPSCGGEIKFQSPVSVTCICPYCRSLVVRHDKDVEAIGKMAELPDDISPFQLGTQGVYKGTHFTLVGRVVIGWEDGRWNEWFIQVDGDKKGWLAEAQGSLAISFETALAADVEKELRSAELGDALTIAGQEFGVDDIKDALCIASDGELPLVASQGRKARVIDMVNADGGFASVEFPKDGSGPRFYLGEYVEFDDLHFSGLRELPGWKMPLSRTPSGAGSGTNG